VSDEPAGILLTAYRPLNIWGLLAVVGIVACRGSLSPIQNKIQVGEEAYAVFAADGEGGMGDLYAVRATGGPTFPITFSRVDESAPALSPDGSMLAFVRARSVRDSTTELWVMNLLNGAERRLGAPAPVVRVTRAGWSRDGRTLYARSDHGTFRVAAPPAPPAPAWVDRTDAEADSALMIILGDPPFARAEPCARQPGLCAVDRSGVTTVLSGDGYDAARWGDDSVGYFSENVLLVRPLGGGSLRQINFLRAPVRPRQLSVFPGKPAR
jgi:hypothetical protein